MRSFSENSEYPESNSRYAEKENRTKILPKQRINKKFQIDISEISKAKSEIMKVSSNSLNLQIISLEKDCEMIALKLPMPEIKIIVAETFTENKI